MANNSTISIGFKLEDASGGFKKLIMDAESFRKAMGAAVVETEKLKKPFVNFASLATGLDSFNSTLNNLQSTVKSLTDAYQIQKVAETQLETVMRQRMCATEEEISSIKALASEQQKLGVIGDEVQLSGAQQMATFLKEKSSIDVLLPAMNNLLAQQKGLNATNQDAVSVGNLMGKAMQGQTSALTRVGITFDASQEKIMKFGNESQRAAMLAEIITQNVGNMNTELAKTDSGKQKQLENDLGDLKETAGSLLQGIQPYLTFAASATTALTGVIKLYNGVKIIGLIMLSFGSKTLSVCKILTVSFQGSLKQTRRAFQLYNAAAKGGAAASLAFKVALRGALIATGVGIAIAAVTGIIAYFALRTDEATAATNKLLDAEARAKREAENLEQARQREESSIKASTAALELNIAKLKEFSGTKEQEQKLVSEMNNTYGSTIGYFSSVSDWYKALTANSEAYCRQMVIEARTRMLADQIAQKEQEKQDIIYDKNGNHKKYSTKKGKWVEDKTKILGYADTINPDGTISRGTQAIYGGKYEDSEWEKATAAVKKLNQEKEALAKQLEDAVKDAASIEFSIKGDSTPPTTPNTPTPTSDKQIPEGSKEYYKNQASDLNRKIGLELDGYSQQIDPLWII
ncbi:hypothetical protein [Muribaculum sp.]|jgi:hypothetical protein|uniref:hypothetical protein n=1 Tax=Muribaculum sp. TaxID=1918611 RepID=UPI00257FD2CA|nr:hypothetical protein [Muribaculum sp.]